MTALAQRPVDRTLSNSRSVCFSSCNFRHFMAYELGLRSVVNAKTRRMGTAFHKGTELKDKGASVAEALDGALALYESMPQGWDAHVWGVERETVRHILNGYWWAWSQPADPSVTVKRVIETEQPFEIQVGGVTVVGMLDSLVELGDGRLAVHERKTVSEDLAPDSEYWPQKRMDNQITIYYAAARARGWDVSTVLYDATCKPSIRPRQIPEVDADGVKVVVDAEGNRVRTNDGKKWRESADSKRGFVLRGRVETPEEFGERVRLDIAADPGKYFARREQPRTEADLEEMYRDLAVTQDLMDVARYRGWWPKNTSQCTKPYRCEFFDPCRQKWTPDMGIPDGFVQLTVTHPELEKETA